MEARATVAFSCVDLGLRVISCGGAALGGDIAAGSSSGSGWQAFQVFKE